MSRKEKTTLKEPTNITNHVQDMLKQNKNSPAEQQLTKSMKPTAKLVEL